MFTIVKEALTNNCYNDVFNKIITISIQQIFLICRHMDNILEYYSLLVMNTNTF